MNAIRPYMNNNSPSYPVNEFTSDVYTSGFTIRGIQYYYNSFYDSVRLRFVVKGTWCPIGDDYNAGTVQSNNNTTLCFYDLD